MQSHPFHVVEYCISMGSLKVANSRFTVHADSEDEMIKCSKCKEWFHYTCVDLEPGTKIKGSWLCAKCIL